MEIEYAYSSIINPALELLPHAMNTIQAKVLLGAIGMQESRFNHTSQIGGPAQGYWQFEKGGVRGVITHSASRHHAESVCASFNVDFVDNDIYHALAQNEILACCFARLLLYTDPHPLPEIQEINEAWKYYLRNWRPGNPKEATWGICYMTALHAVQGVV